MELETPIGIIIPPSNIRTILDKTAQFVAKNGPEFESRIRKNEAQNIKFNFLKDDDPYNSFYRHRVAAFKSGEAQEEAKKRADEEAQKAAEEAERKKQEEDLAIDKDGNVIGGANQNFIPTEPPPKFEFIVEVPTVNARELDTILLTAQFVAKNGKSFLTELMHREARNYHFDFLRPQHSLFPFFTSMVEQYTKVLIPSRAMLNTIERDSQREHRSLIDYKKDVNYRVEWTRHQRRQRAQEEEQLEKDKEHYNQIDWHDFVIVETVDYMQTESLTAHENFPPPVTIEELGKRLTQQLRYEEFGEDGVKQQLEDERLAKEAEERRQEEMADMRRMQADAEREAEEEAERKAEEERLEKQRIIEQQEEEIRLAELEAERIARDRLEAERKALATENEDLYGDMDDVEEIADGPPVQVPRPSFVKPNVIRSYDPKRDSNVYEKTGILPSSAEKWLTSPLTGEKIRADKLEEHVRYGLLDPNFSDEKRKRLLDSMHAGGVHATSAAMARSLEKLAQRRTDIFGVEETAIGRKVQDSDKDKEIREQATKTWDGHAGSAELVTARAKKTSATREALDRQIEENLLAKGLNPEVKEGGIGPMTTGSTMQNPTLSAAAQAGKMPPPPPPQADKLINPMATKYEAVPHTVLSPSILTQKLPSGKPNKRQILTIENKSLEDKLKEKEGMDDDNPQHFIGDDDVAKEAEYAGLSIGSKKQKLDDDFTKKYSSVEFIEKYSTEETGTMGRYTIQCPMNEEWKCTNQRLNWDIDLRSTIKELKLRLEAELGMPLSKQKLQYDGKFMNQNDATFADMNVLPGGIIHLIIKTRGGRK